MTNHTEHAESLVDRFIAWGVNRTRCGAQSIVTFAGDELFRRYSFLWPDESIHGAKHYNRPPWWRPFNVLLHCWAPQHMPEEFHDHPRWSITVCLKGEIVEVTPWRERLLRPGSVVIRSRKAIHAFRPSPTHSGETWTLFIVGRRNHVQSTYSIESRVGVAGQVAK